MTYQTVFYVPPGRMWAVWRWLRERGKEGSIPVVHNGLGRISVLSMSYGLADKVREAWPDVSYAMNHV